MNGELVAKDVLECVKKRDKVNMYQIAIKRGYKPYTARNPVRITSTEGYRSVMEPYLKQLEVHRNKVLKAMESKDLDSEDYKVLSESLDRLTKQTQLLSGKATENVQTTVTVVNYAEFDNVPEHVTNTPLPDSQADGAEVQAAIGESQEHELENL